jgi:hypothetical protein
VLWARPSAHNAAHGPFTRSVPPMGHNNFRRTVLAHSTICVLRAVHLLHLTAATSVDFDPQGGVPELHLLCGFLIIRRLRVLAVGHCHWHCHRNHRRRRVWRLIQAPSRSTSEVSRSPEQGRRQAQGKKWRGIGSEIQQEQERQRELRTAAARWGEVI